VIKSSGSEKYIKGLRQRAKESHVYKKYQMTGIMLAEILSDPAHTSLYIKLAKENDNEKLMQIAKDISERKDVKNKGAYFMYSLTNEKKNGTRNPSNRK